MTAVIFGANGGVGAALVRQIAASNTFSRVVGIARNKNSIEGHFSGISNLQTEFVSSFTDEQLCSVIESIGKDSDIKACICSIGILSNESGLKPERSYRDQSRENFEKVFEVNTIIPALIAKHILPVMNKKERTIFAALSARVGSIGDNKLGGWHAYRASKSALNMLIKNYSIEQTRKNKQSIVVGLHPGTVDTNLSKPFQNNVPKDKLFSVEYSASCLVDVLNSLTPEDTGGIFDWAGKRIPE